MTPSYRRYPWEMVFRPGTLPIVADRHTLEGDLEPHDHAFVEVAVIVSGSGIHRTIHGEEPLRRGQALILRPGNWHAYLACRQLVVFNCLFGEELLARELAWMETHAELSWMLQLGARAGAEEGPALLSVQESALASLLDLLDSFHFPGSDTAGGHVRRVGLLVQCLGQLVDQLSDAQRSEATRGSQAHPLVLRAIAAMRAEPSHPWSIDELCALLHGIDSSYLSRLFRSGVGLPPLGWLIRHRANLAAVQLVQSETPISEIGGAVGWPDPNHFARRFRGVFGESPREYRSRRRISESD